VSIDALISGRLDDKKIEIIFVTIFSVLILAIFYVLISMNGVVLGNDPAVHLEKAQIFLNTGQISLANLGWTPPLYEIVLAMFISVTGAASIGQFIFLVKVLTAIVDWLFFMGVYLFARKFFDRRIAIAAVILLLMCSPVYEMNQFGGSTTVLALAFVFLVLLYTPLAVERLGYLVVAFFAAFALVLSHQLAAFLAVFIMPPILLFMLIKSRGAHLKVVFALILGGGIAFLLYYFKAMWGYLDLVIEYVFFAVKSYAYQIPYVSFGEFLLNFGFILFFGLGGLVISFYLLRKQKKSLFFLTLFLSFFIPLFFAESWLFGLYLPFQWFIYYLTPPLAVYAAVFSVFLFERFVGFYRNNRLKFKKSWARIAIISMIVLLIVMVAYRSDVVYGRIMQASVYYATSDAKAYDAGVWLKSTYPENVTVVDTEIPGFWFQEFSGKNVIAQTDPTVQRNEIAESVLSLSYEIEHSQTMIRAYEAKGDIYEEIFAPINQVWDRVSYCSAAGDFINLTVNGNEFKFPLSQLNKQVILEDQVVPKRVIVEYSNEFVNLTKTIEVDNNGYPFNVTWEINPLENEIYNVKLYLSTYFELKFHFDEVQIPQFLDWINPWDAPASIRDAHGGDWAVVNFTNSELIDHYIGLYDSASNVAFAFKFADLPDWGNIGVLGNRQVDAVRFQYQFSSLTVNQSISRSYQILAMTQNSYPSLQPSSLLNMFELETAKFLVSARDFTDYIKSNDIGFIVYDRNQLDTQMIHSKLLQLIYSNDRYVIFKVLT
jgi:hypothetical protein